MNTLDQIIPECMEFASPDGCNHQARLLDAFVGDTSLGFTDSGELDFIALTNRLGEMAQTWEQLLHLSGGALNLKKCLYHILFWEWKVERPVLRPIHDDDPALRLYEGTNRAVDQSEEPTRPPLPAFLACISPLLVTSYPKYKC